MAGGSWVSRRTVANCLNGVRLARVRGWDAFEAFFYCHRAVALLKLGRPGAAAVCRRRAGQLADPLDRWTTAWLARVDSLLALSQSDTAAEGLFRASNFHHRR